MKGYVRGTFRMFMSFFVALMLLIVPLPTAMAWLRPQFVVLVLIYWCTYNPGRIGVVMAWLLGLIVDALYGGLLGPNALGMAFIAYFATELSPRMRMYPMPQQMFGVLVLAGLAQMIVVWANYLTGATYQYYLQWVPMVTTALCWPFVCGVLGSLRVKQTFE